MPNEGASGSDPVESTKLSDIFWILPDFEGDQVSLEISLNACHCRDNIASEDQRDFFMVQKLINEQSCFILEI